MSDETNAPSTDSVEQVNETPVLPVGASGRLALMAAGRKAFVEGRYSEWSQRTLDELTESEADTGTTDNERLDGTEGPLVSDVQSGHGEEAED